MDSTSRSKGGEGGLARRSQEHPLELFRREVSSLFDRFFQGGWLAPFGEGPASERYWDFDVQEGDTEIVVRAEMPGFEENELTVEVNNDVLTIRAEKQQKGEGEERYQSFHRSVTLPSGVDVEKAQATYRNGVLELHLPRPEGTGGKRIPIGGQPPGSQSVKK